MGNKLKVIVFGLIVSVYSCEGDKPVKPKVEVNKPKQISVEVPQFNSDSAYQFIQKQVDFGPRVPNTKSHLKCADYLADKLRGYNAKVIVQPGKVTAFNGAELKIRNIIAQFQPEKTNRVMLFAHWDTRPFADRDTKNKAKPIDGANDGGSGVGVLLEIARQLNSKPTNVGVDIMLFDAEDYGEAQGGVSSSQVLDDWCLGTQYWANNPPIPNYNAKYGILLDMVGAKNAVFPKEYVSMYFAEDIVNKVWNTAGELGYGNFFVNQKIPANRRITDDHLYVNNLAKIPAIDIIHYELDRFDFGHFHHTHKDNMDIIDKTTLKAVGQTVMHVVYNEK